MRRGRRGDALEVQDGEPVFAAAGPPGTPALEPTVADGDVLVIGTLTDAADSVAAEDTVRELRTDLDEALGAGTAVVGGETATDIDTNDTSTRDRTVIIPVVLAVIVVILMLLLRSILAPVLLIATVNRAPSAVTAAVFGYALGAAATVTIYVLWYGRRKRPRTSLEPDAPASPSAVTGSTFPARW